MVLTLVAAGVVLAGCGGEPASVTSTPGPGSSARVSGSEESESGSEDGWSENAGGMTDEQLAHEVWLDGGPLATTAPIRNCVEHDSTEEERAAYEAAQANGDMTLPDPDGMSCLDLAPPQPVEPCVPPPDLAEGETFGCISWGPPALTQRRVEEWNAFVEQEDAAAAQASGMSVAEYRATLTTRYPTP